MNKQRSKKTYRSFASIVLASALATTSFGIATTSQSAVRRLAAVSACSILHGNGSFTDSPTFQETSTNDGSGAGFWGFMPYVNGGATVLCTIPSSSTLLHHNISNVTVSGRQAGGDDIDLRVCTYDWDSISYDCGSWKDVGSGTRYFDTSVSDLFTTYRPLFLVSSSCSRGNDSAIESEGNLYFWIMIRASRCAQARKPSQISCSWFGFPNVATTLQSSGAWQRRQILDASRQWFGRQ